MTPQELLFDQNKGLAAIYAKKWYERDVLVMRDDAEQVALMSILKSSKDFDGRGEFIPYARQHIKFDLADEMRHMHPLSRSGPGKPGIWPIFEEYKELSHDENGPIRSQASTPANQLCDLMADEIRNSPKVATPKVLTLTEIESRRLSGRIRQARWRAKRAKVSPTPYPR
jgi:hypothetical protein